MEQAALNWLREEGDSWTPWVTGMVRAALTAGAEAKGLPSQQPVPPA